MFLSLCFVNNLKIKTYEDLKWSWLALVTVRMCLSKCEAVELTGVTLHCHWSYREVYQTFCVAASQVYWTSAEHVAGHDLPQPQIDIC